MKRTVLSALHALLPLLALAGAGVVGTAAQSVHAATLKIATLAPDGSTWMREMRAAAESIATGSDGRVQVKIYPGGVMGTDATVLRKIRLGQLQGGAFTGSELSAVFRDAQIYSVPFLLRNDAEVDAVRKAHDQRLLQGFSENGFEAVGITGVGFAYLMSVQPIRTRDDLQRAKVWVPQNDYIAEVTFRTGGVQPVPLALADAFTSLQTGLVDTVATTPTGAIALQWHTSLRYVVDLPLSYVVGYVVLAQRPFQRLQESDQQLVREAFAAAAANIDAANRRDNAQALEALRGQGLEVIAPSQQERALWQSIGDSALERLVSEDVVTADFLAAIQSTLAPLREPTGERPRP